MPAQIISFSPPLTMEATIPRFPGWKVEATFARQGGTYVIERCEVLPHEPGEVPDGGVTALLLRAVPLSQLPQLLSTRSANGRTVADLVDAFEGPGAVEELARTPRPGRKGRADAFYARWAAEYVARCQVSSSAIDDLAQAHDYSRSRIRDFVSEARRRELLTPGIKGRAGGSLTDKAKQILKEESGR